MCNKDHNKMTIPFITITIFVIATPLVAYAATLSSDVDALRSFKEEIDPNSIPEYSYLGSWNFSVDPCESTGDNFLGILCMVANDNTTSSRIIALELDNAGYDGFLTRDLGNLTELTVLNLRKNKFRGPLPNSMMMLNKLTTLIVSDNFFTGSLPEGLRSLNRIQELDVSSNKLTGSIPAWINNLRSMTSLKMSNNGFSGSIPDLAGLWQLTTLDLSDNELFGDLPKLPTSLRMLFLRKNVLSGNIHLLWRLQSLTVLDLSNNRLTGSVRGVITLPEVVSLNLSTNWFTGFEVAKFDGRETRLQVLDLQENRLQGHLPVNLVTLTNLAVINLSHNQLSGPIPRDYGKRIGAPWRRLYLDHNFLAGVVPPDFGGPKLKFRGYLSYNCLRCPRNVTLCDRQRPVSECLGQMSS